VKQGDPKELAARAREDYIKVHILKVIFLHMIFIRQLHVQIFYDSYWYRNIVEYA
jgi:hypothetical protein